MFKNLLLIYSAVTVLTIGSLKAMDGAMDENAPPVNPSKMKLNNSIVNDPQEFHSMIRDEESQVDSTNATPPQKGLSELKSNKKRLGNPIKLSPAKRVKVETIALPPEIWGLILNFTTKSIRPLKLVCKDFQRFFESHQPKAWTFNRENYPFFKRCQLESNGWIDEALQTVQSLTFFNLIPDPASDEDFSFDYSSGASEDSSEEWDGKNVVLSKNDFQSFLIETIKLREQDEKHVFISKEEFQTLLTKASNLKELQIGNIPNIQNYMDYLFPWTPTLQSFSFNYIEGQCPLIQERALYALSRFTALEKLFINADIFPDENKDVVSQFFSCFKNLNTLTLVGVRRDDLDNPNDADFLTLLSEAPLSKLSSLKIDFSQAPGTIEVLASLPSLTSLEMTYEDLYTPVDDEISSISSNFPALQKLSVRNMADSFTVDENFSPAN